MQAPTAGLHLQPPPARHWPEGRGIKPKALQQCPYDGSGQILPRKTLLTSWGLDGLLITTAGFVSIFYFGCNAESPSGQHGVAGAEKGQGLPGASSCGGWRWVLGCPACAPGCSVCAAVGKSRNVGLALPGQGSCCCPFQLWAPRPAEDRRGEKISVTLGFSVPFAAGLSEGGMGKGVKRFPSSNWRWAQSRLKPFLGAV